MVLHDVRRALRQLSQKPGFTATVVFTLAPGIGATTSVSQPPPRLPALFKECCSM